MTSYDDDGVPVLDNADVKSSDTLTSSDVSTTSPDDVMTSYDEEYVPAVGDDDAKSSSDYYNTDEDDTEDDCLLYTSPSPRDRQKSRMPSSA